MPPSWTLTGPVRPGRMVCAPESRLSPLCRKPEDKTIAKSQIMKKTMLFELALALNSDEEVENTAFAIDESANKRNGYTLPELLVTICVIGLLMAILLPAVQRAKKQARSIACQSNQRQWGIAFTVDDEPIRHYTCFRSHYCSPSLNVVICPSYFWSNSFEIHSVGPVLDRASRFSKSLIQGLGHFTRQGVRSGTSAPERL